MHDHAIAPRRRTGMFEDAQKRVDVLGLVVDVYMRESAPYTAAQNAQTREELGESG
jgi:hypothetical protein